MQMYEQGYTYSFTDLFVQFVRLIFRLRIPWQQKHSVICSMFGFDCYQAAGIRIAKNKNCAPDVFAIYGALERRGTLAA